MTGKLLVNMMDSLLVVCVVGCLAVLLLGLRDGL